MPIPLNEVTLSIAGAAVILGYVFRKRIWRGITGWINGEPEQEHAASTEPDNSRPHI